MYRVLILTVQLFSVNEPLGFGSYKGVCNFQQGQLVVTVKILDLNSPKDVKAKFLQEAATMGQFNHPNVVQLHGVVTVSEPVSLLISFCISSAHCLANDSPGNTA